MSDEMNTLRVEVSSLGNSAARAVQAMETGEPQGRYLSFETPEMLVRMLGGRRLAVLNALLGGRAMGVRELARRLGRDVRAVHNDTEKLVQAGVVEKTEDGKLCCPYREIVCEFALRLAA